MAVNNIDNIILRTEGTIAAEVRVKDLGAGVAAGGGTITYTTLNEAIMLFMSEDLWDPAKQSLVDDFLGAGDSTLQFFDGTNKIAQGDARAWLTQRILNAGDAAFGVVKTNASAQIDKSLTFDGTATVSNFKAGTDISAGGFKLTNLAEPTLGTDATTKSYVDNLIVGLKWLNQPARVASASNLTLSGTQTVDGVVLAAGERILLIAQTDPIENGVWTVAAGAWSRPADFATGLEAANTALFVSEGTTYADTAWTMTADAGSDVVDTDPLTWAQFSGAGSINAGDGLVKVGNTLSADYGTLGQMAGVSSVNVVGTAVELARIDHTHAHGDRGTDPAGSQHDADQIDVETAGTRIGAPGTVEAVLAQINTNFGDAKYVGKQLHFGYNKTIKGSQAQALYGPGNVSSESAPVRMLRAGRISGGSISAEQADGTNIYVMEIHKNGALAESLTLGSGVDGAQDPAFSAVYAAGDKISVFLEYVSGANANSTASDFTAVVEYVEG